MVDRVSYAVIGFSAVLYLFVRLNLPLVLYPDASVDDGLFIHLAKELAAGNYLGNYGTHTFAKGPGYPLFLAFSHFSGLPISVSHALLFLVAISAFCLAAGALFQSKIVAGILFVALTLHPAFLVDRVMREAVYTPQVFLLLAFAIGIVYGRCTRMTLCGAAGGMVFAWFWLTREEGVWILPGLAILGVILALTWRSDTTERRRAKAQGMAAFVVLAALGIMAYPAANWIAYGSFQGNDLKEANFSDALQSLQSVRDGDQIPYVPVSASTRRVVYAVSPTFASLRPRLDPEGGRGPGLGCAFHPQSCGDIAGGWLVWELRTAAANVGTFTTPSQASAFFGKIAAEVRAACNDGRLNCETNLVPLMPSLKSGQFAALWPTFRDTVVFLADVPRHRGAGLSSGTPVQRDDALRFLNSPTIMPNASEYTRVLVVGTYEHSASRPFLIGVADVAGATAVQELVPLHAVSPAYRSNLPANATRHFHLVAACDASCSVVVAAESGASIKIPVKALLGNAKKFGQPGSEIEIAARMMPYTPTVAQALAERVHAALVQVYRFALPIALPLGLAAFLASLVLSWVQGGGFALVGFAGCLWVLVASRLALITLVNVSAFPAINASYLNPALYLSVAAAVVSIACFVRVWARRTDRSVT